MTPFPILPLARAKGVGTIGFKAFGAGKLLGDTEGYGKPLAGAAGGGGAPKLPHLSVEECVHYMMTVDPDVCLLGMSSAEEMSAALSAANRFRPLSAAQMADLRRRAEAAVKGKGRCWWNPQPSPP